MSEFHESEFLEFLWQHTAAACWFCCVRMLASGLDANSVNVECMSSFGLKDRSNLRRHRASKMEDDSTRTDSSTDADTEEKNSRVLQFFIIYI